MRNNSNLLNIDSADEFYVADWHVDITINTISCNDKTVKLEPKVMAVLKCLAAHTGEGVTRETLEETVWAGSVVGYDALSNTIIKLRKAFGDKARNPRIIGTISKKGYRLLVDVALTKQVGGDNVETSPVSVIQASDQFNITQKPEMPTRPSVAVLAFKNLSNDPNQEYFSDGLTEDITTDLSKFPGLLVIARNSAFSYKAQFVENQILHANLGVRYVLHGSVRKFRSQLRINTALVDLLSGEQLWAERYDRELTKVFEVQDEVRQRILSKLMPVLLSSDMNFHNNRFANSVDAYDYFLQGRERAVLGTEKSLIFASENIKQAIRIDPNYSPAWSHLGLILTLNSLNRWGAHEDQSIEQGLEYGFRAIGLDESNAHAHFSVAATALWMKQYEMAEDAAKKAIEINANFADGYALLGSILLYLGRPEESIHALHKALRLDPLYRDISLHTLAQAHYHNRDFDNAITILKIRLQSSPDSDIGYALLAACYGMMNEKDQGKLAWSQVLQINPDHSIRRRCEVLPYKYKEDLQYYLKGLSVLGVAIGN